MDKIMGVYQLVIPDWLPVTLNQLLGHWRRSGRRKRSDREVIRGYWFASGWPAARGRRRVSITLTQVSGRPRDPDGVRKSVLDALVHAGAIVDDSQLWLEEGPVTIEFGARRQTQIVLEDV
jgi:hypothetical protein